MGEASNDIRYRVLENWCLAHTGEKHNLEQATEHLSQILNDHVNILLSFYLIISFSRKIMLVHYAR
jgi:hypothetical protein